MPQLTLQYTANINQEVNFEGLFSKSHEILSDVGGIKIDNCKSRAIRLDDYYIAQGETPHAFVHLDIRFLEGRSIELKKEMGGKFLDLLKEYYAPSIDQFNIQITVEIRDIMKEDYFKFPGGSLTV